MSETYDDERPGMMRVHIAQQRARALCDHYTRDTLREMAREHGLRLGGDKREVAWRLVVYRGVTAPGYDKASES